MAIDIRSIVSNITQNYYPFRLLSTKRAKEAFDAMRVIQLKEGEGMTLKGSTGRDYLYVIEGEVKIKHYLESASIVKAQDTQTKPLLAPPLPYDLKIHARRNSIVCHANSGMFDYLLLWDELGHTLDSDDTETRYRIEHIRNTLAFQRLPLQSLIEAIKRMRLQKVDKGQNLCFDGKSEPAYYVLIHGRAEAIRDDNHGSNKIKVADIMPGDVFGEKCVGPGAFPGDSVNMVEDGNVLTLSKTDFDEIISNPIIDEVDSRTAIKMIDKGEALLVDVRHQMERDESSIPGSIFIPLHDLRKRLKELSNGKIYIAYCRSGKRSKAAAHIMELGGVDAVSLKGGIISWPFKIDGVKC